MRNVLLHIIIYLETKFFSADFTFSKTNDEEKVKFYPLNFHTGVHLTQFYTMLAEYRVNLLILI